jgi:hypothetical protein
MKPNTTAHFIVTVQLPDGSQATEFTESNRRIPEGHSTLIDAGKLLWDMYDTYDDPKINFGVFAVWPCDPLSFTFQNVTDDAIDAAFEAMLIEIGYHEELPEFFDKYVGDAQQRFDDAKEQYEDERRHERLESMH